MKLSFSEIENWQEFENLATSFFEKISKDKNDAIEVFVEPSGTGSDGGRDILVTTNVNDSFVSYRRKWVVQCKFYDKDLSKSVLSDINVPSLIQEHGADGYLLICKNGVTSPLSDQFEGLRKNCTMNKNYLIWTGSQFLDKLILHKDIIQRYFPLYFKETYIKTNAETIYNEAYEKISNEIKTDLP
jgi:hypothetical protein